MPFISKLFYLRGNILFCIRIVVPKALNIAIYFISSIIVRYTSNYTVLRFSINNSGNYNFTLLFIMKRMSNVSQFSENFSYNIIQFIIKSNQSIILLHFVFCLIITLYHFVFCFILMTKSKNRKIIFSETKKGLLLKYSQLCHILIFPFRSILVK